MLLDFTQPRSPQSQGGPSGSTMMCPISPAFPEVPRTTSSFRTMPQPMPVPMYIKMKLPEPLGPPAQVSATAALVTSLSTRVDSPVASARASRRGTRSQPSNSGGSTTVPSSRLMGPGAATPSPAILSGSTPEAATRSLISAAMVAMMPSGSLAPGVLIRECLTTEPTRSSTTKVVTAGSKWTPTAYIPAGFNRRMVRGLPGPLPSFPASTMRFWSSSRREMLEMVCGESPTIWASSTRLRPPEDRRMASNITVRLKSPMRGKLVPRLGVGVRISVTDSPKRLRLCTTDA
ncbi:hypothetical protein D9M72_434470 [compost metagenome]